MPPGGAMLGEARGRSDWRSVFLKICKRVMDGVGGTMPSDALR